MDGLLDRCLHQLHLVAFLPFFLRICLKFKNYNNVHPVSVQLNQVVLVNCNSFGYIL